MLQVEIDYHLKPIKLYWITQNDDRINITWAADFLYKKIQEILPKILTEIISVKLSDCKIITEYYQN